ncbi:MAG: archease [Thermodesulfovibrionales bacterium]|jgi:SHS2 domain-containing protein
MVLLAMNFEVLDISGDAGIRSFGKSWAEAFSNAGIGMYSLITSSEGVMEKEVRVVELENDTLDGLLVSFLNELVFHFDSYGFIGRSIEVTPLSLATPFRIWARLHGEEFDPSRHDRRLLIKAATYHRLLLEEHEGCWKAEVIFDI